MKENLPELSHLQALVLERLGAFRLSGRDLRSELARKGTRKSGPAFYQLMGRLEDAGFVAGEYSQKIIEGQIIKERNYRMTGQGSEALAQTFSFYHGLQEVILGGAHA